MRYGCCVPASADDLPTYSERIQIIKNAGFDYIEVGVSQLAALSDEAFQQVRTKINEIGITAESANGFMPGELKVTGPTVQWDQVQNYLKKAIGRIASLEGEIIVFGSGGARSIPDGYTGWKQDIEKFLGLAGEIAQPYHITIVIEPLRKAESNILNQSVDGKPFWNRHIKQLIDFYHFEEEQEPIDHFQTVGDALYHIHAADTGRYYPGSGSYPYDQYKQAIKQIGYDKRISIECSWNDFPTECKKGLTFLQRTFG
jgi:sugar phosphate isomerase/epimerase